MKLTHENLLSNPVEFLKSLHCGFDVNEMKRIENPDLSDFSIVNSNREDGCWNPHWAVIIWKKSNKIILQRTETGCTGSDGYYQKEYFWEK